MNEILSNQEIDALLDMFESEGMPEDLDESQGLDTAADGFRVEGEVAPLDLLKPNRFTRDQILIIQRIQEMVARKLGGTISDRLRLDVSCDCVAVEQLRFSSWLSMLDNPIGVYPVEVKPLTHPGVLTVSAELLYGAVDRILGGPGIAGSMPTDLSDAEHAVADAIVAPISQQLGHGLSEIVPVEVAVTARHTNPAMAQILPMQEVVLALHFQLSGKPLMGDIRLALPYAALEPHLGSLEQSRFLSPGMGKGAFREVLGETVAGVKLGVACMLGSTEISLGDLLSLSVGDVIPLPVHPGDPAVVPVQGHGKYEGQLGVRNGRYGVRVEHVTKEGVAG